MENIWLPHVAHRTYLGIPIMPATAADGRQLPMLLLLLLCRLCCCRDAIFQRVLLQLKIFQLPRLAALVLLWLENHSASLAARDAIQVFAKLSASSNSSSSSNAGNTSNWQHMLARVDVDVSWPRACSRQQQPPLPFSIKNCDWQQVLLMVRPTDLDADAPVRWSNRSSFLSRPLAG